MKAVLALDQGTTSSRAILFDKSGRVIGASQREFPQHYPQPGWVEHDAMDIWESQLDCAKRAIREAGLNPRDIAAIGVTNQRETAILWDRSSGRPVHRAIVWQDRRTAELCERLRRRGLEPSIARKTGLRLDPYFSATKVTWMLDHSKKLRRDAENGRVAFGTVDSWLVHQLTEGGLHVTDASNASRTLLFNIRTGRWDAALLRLFGVPAPMLPAVRDSSEVVGVVSKRWFGAEIPIAGIAGDQQAALFGQLGIRPGLVKNTYGTGLFMLMNTGTRPVFSRNRLLTTVAWRLKGEMTYALEGSVFIGGAAVQWLRDGLRLIQRSADIEPLAASVPDSGGVVLVPAFTGLGAPYWDPYARGTVVGITRGTSAAHLARATLEAIAHQSADVLDAMRRDARLTLREVRVDGGASENNLLMQIQADLARVPVVRPAVRETTALGAAMLAALAVGFWRNLQELERIWALDRRFRPRQPAAASRRARERWAEAVRRSLGWARAGGGVGQ